MGQVKEVLEQGGRGWNRTKKGKGLGSGQEGVELVASVHTENVYIIGSPSPIWTMGQRYMLVGVGSWTEGCPTGRAFRAKAGLFSSSGRLADGAVGLSDLARGWSDCHPI